MIQLRYRRWDLDDWTSVSLEGDAEEELLSVLGSRVYEGELEILLDEDWLAIGEEQ